MLKFSESIPFEKVWHIYDISQLRWIKGNRLPYGDHEKAIYNAFLQNEYIPPVFVTKSGYIVDGQHRIRAFERIKNEIIDNKLEDRKNFFLRLFIIDSDEDPFQLAIKFNSRRKNWTTTDYLHGYQMQGFSSYVKLYNFRQEVNNYLAENDLSCELEIRAAVQIIKGSYSTETFKNGGLEISQVDLDNAFNKINILIQLAQDNNLGSIVLRRDVILAFYRIYKDIKDINTFIQRAKTMVIPIVDSVSAWVLAYQTIL